MDETDGKLGFTEQPMAAEWKMKNGKWKMENDCVRKAHDLKSFPKEIPQFSIFNFQFSIAQQLDKLKFERPMEVSYGI